MSQASYSNAKLIMTCSPEDGKLFPVAKSLFFRAYPRALNKIFKLICKKVPKTADVSFGVIHTGRPDEKVKIEKKLENCFRIFETSTSQYWHLTSGATQGREAWE